MESRFTCTRPALGAALLLLGLQLPGLAMADIYGFTDANGTTHVSNVPQDGRYTLLLHTPKDSAAGAQNPPAPGPASESATAAIDPKLRAQFNSIIDEAARTLNLDPALLNAVITAESGYNPQARSPKGAMGLMQLMPDTASRYGVTDPYDPAQNIWAGARYLRDLLTRFDNNLPLVLAAYNAGENAVAKNGNAIPPYPETRNYVPRVMSFYTRYQPVP
jgi:soluble lytic murein transglycosylase-like protein